MLYPNQLATLSLKNPCGKTSQCRELHSDQLGCLLHLLSHYPTRFGGVGILRSPLLSFPRADLGFIHYQLTPLGGSMSVELSIEGHFELCNLPHIHDPLKYIQVAYISKCNKTDMKCKYKLSGRVLV
jgi:hypothetical protein